MDIPTHTWMSLPDSLCSNPVGVECPLRCGSTVVVSASTTGTLQLPQCPVVATATSVSEPACETLGQDEETVLVIDGDGDGRWTLTCVFRG